MPQVLFEFYFTLELFCAAFECDVCLERCFYKTTFIEHAYILYVYECIYNMYIS